MDLDLRRLTVDDADEFAALSTIVERDHRTNLELSPQEFREFLPGADATIDGAYADGELIAWTGFMHRAPHGGSQTFDVMGEVHPGHAGRGIGTFLAQHALDLARDVHAEEAPDLPAVYVYRSVAGRPDATDIAARLGFAAERYRFNMTADLSLLEPTVELPVEVTDAYEPVVFEPSDAELMLTAHNAAFHDYPNHTPMSEQMWQAFMIEAQHTRHQLSHWLRARADGRVAAYVFAHEYSSPLSGLPDVTESYLPYIGTLPAHRGRGLASLLIRHALFTHRDAGYTHCSLEVDAENPTGALGIYERAGFVVGARFDEYYLREAARPAR